MEGEHNAQRIPAKRAASDNNDGWEPATTNDQRNAGEAFCNGPSLSGLETLESD